MDWEKVAWPEVFVGVVIGMIVTWIPGVAKMAKNMVGCWLDKRLAAKIRRDVMSDPLIVIEDKENEITKRMRLERESRDPFGAHLDSAGGEDDGIRMLGDGD